MKKNKQNKQKHQNLYFHIVIIINYNKSRNEEN